MISIEQAKQMAKRLRASLQAQDQQASHSMALELVAQPPPHAQGRLGSQTPRYPPPALHACMRPAGR